jgi:large subunit ribosomal protein L32
MRQFNSAKNQENKMPVPKRKMSRSKTRSRRANWRTTPTQLITIKIDGVDYKIPHSLVNGVRRGYINPTTL